MYSFVCSRMRLVSSFCGCCVRLKNKLVKWMSNEVDDQDSNYVPAWKAMPFDETFRETLFTIELDKHAKVVIMLRYVELVISVKQKHRSVFASYNILRVTTLLSGLVTPVLFSITNDVPNRAALFWVTLVTSLLGSISNAWLEYFSVIKMHYTYLSASELLESEGWHFCSLTGPYSGYSDHQSCWRAFISNTEKIHNNSVRQYMLNSQPQNRTSSGKELMKQAATTKTTEEYITDGSQEGSAFSDEYTGKRKTGLRMRRRLCGIRSDSKTKTEQNEERTGSDFSSSSPHENNQTHTTSHIDLQKSESNCDITGMYRSVSEGDIELDIESRADVGKEKNISF